MTFIIMLMNRTFAVDKSTMTHWEPPFGDESFTKKDKDGNGNVLGQVEWLGTTGHFGQVKS